MAVRALEPGHGLPHTLLAAVAVHVHVHLHDLGHEKTHKRKLELNQATETNFFLSFSRICLAVFTHG